MTHHCVCHFIMCSLKMALVKVGNTWKNYSAFMNLFHPGVKCIMQRLEWIKDKVFVLFNHTHTHTHIYIYIYTSPFE